MKLSELLGEELYKQVEAKINEANSKESDKLKHIRYADLSEGEYVGKGKHESELEKLKAIISGKDTELESANKLITELKDSTKGNEELQGKITSYEDEIIKLKAALSETKIQSAIKVALLSEKVTDVDYLTFKLNEKLKEKKETLELDDGGNIKGWNDKIAGLKIQFPNMFEDSAEAGSKKLDVEKLPGDPGEGKDEPKSLAEALKQKYEAQKEEE